MKLLLYCTKAKPLFLTYGDCDHGDYTTYFDEYVCDNHYYDYGYEDKVIEPKDFLNGKIVGECDFEVEDIKLIETPEYAGSECNTFLYDVSINFETKTLNEGDLCKQSCLTADELNEYLDLYKEKEAYGKAIHIKNLNVFDEPKELSKYYNRVPMMYSDMRSITSAPQNMRYVEDYFGHKYVLTSIRPELLCKILNGECTIIVKKKVLKEMV